MNFKLWIADTVERVGTTVLEAALVFVIAANGQLDVSRWRALGAAILPGAFNVIKQAAQSYLPKGKSWASDTALRSGWTFLITWAGAASATGFDVFDASAVKTAVLAAFVAALAVVKAALAKLKKNTITPASLASIPVDALPNAV